MIVEICVIVKSKSNNSGLKLRMIIGPIDIDMQNISSYNDEMIYHWYNNVFNRTF